MKGYFNIKPVQYKPKTTWDVSKVLNYISSLYPLQSLCLKLSTFKRITLVALTTAARVQTLAALDLRFMSVYHGKVCFDICTLLKTSRPGRQNPRVVLSMFNNPRLCVVTTLKEYVKRTVKLRKSSLLFVSFITYQAVCTSTLARWLKCVLSLSGIDSSFTAHSFRSASTSYAFNKGVSIKKTIMDTANWASAQTFYKHYYKTVNSNSTIFSNVIHG